MITEDILRKILKNYPQIDANGASFLSESWGLINDSYRVKTLNGEYFLQKVNTEIFSNISAIENNLLCAAEILKNSPTFLSLPIKNFQGSLHTKIPEGVFRIFPFIIGRTLKDPTNDEMRSFGENFARLSQILSPFSAEFQETIPDFHNILLRQKSYQNALKNPKDSSRKEKMLSLVAEISQKQWIVEHFQKILPALPRRVMHHDAKIHNVIFEERNPNVAAIVDLDTLMPGYIFSDFGDMVWSLILGLDHEKPEKTVFSREKYDLLFAAYTSKYPDLSDFEEKTLHFWAIMISHMLTLRFATDYILGDKYFKISYSEQNFDRAWHQNYATNLLIAELKTLSGV